jgi:hypothetical protein
MIKAGDRIEIKPEWQDKGDDLFDFFAIEDQLDGMDCVKARAFYKSTGEKCIGIQSIRLEHMIP